ncbi:hypothetical protein K470DRAFT_57866, partial [Piedraia hortae CBS 480.64]
MTCYIFAFPILFATAWREWPFFLGFAHKFGGLDASVLVVEAWAAAFCAGQFFANFATSVDGPVELEGLGLLL